MPRRPAAAVPWLMDGHVLVVEDDPSIREVTAIGLRRSGFRVSTTGDGHGALEHWRTGGVDLIVLDVMLPGLDGLQVCQAVRRSSGVPILMVTARTDTTDVVAGLECGADDYLRKPFEPAELVARVRALLRRGTHPEEETVLRIGGLAIDPARFTVHREDREVPLTATEFRLLLELARRPGRVFTRDLLLDRVWGYPYLGDSRLVDVAVQRLRAKIEADPARPELVRTVRGVGYKLTGH